MPELRLNVITRDWVIMATERAKRPEEFVSLERTSLLPRLAYESGCPFCPGNESQTLKECLRLGDTGKWRVRVVPNKFPALNEEGQRIRTARGIFRSMNAVGFHEVIIEHPRHNTTTALLDQREIVDILSVYRQRYSEIKEDQRIEAIIIYKNHGESAGTSLVHPHSQLAATPVVPFQFRGRIAEAVRYFDEHGGCIFCRMVREELDLKERIIFESDHFAAFIPYAALSPFHTWIFPRRHASSFDEITDVELQDFALAVKTVLARLYHGLHNPDYNYSIRSIPTHDGNTDYFHWYLTIIPRVTKTAGFEYGSGMFINTALPEESAAFLRSVTIPE
ncbi:MAG: galactose-1-phosphate uridylyltransferase [Ignavibacteriae bacterium]|nr:galactose-1-phosphate uridylyltransferase [Ignavibacteriota bacterium]